MPDQDPWAAMAAQTGGTATATAPDPWESMAQQSGGTAAPNRPTPQIVGDAGGVHLQTKVDPWEQAAAKNNIQQGMESGQNLVPALQQADRVGGSPAGEPRNPASWQLPTVANQNNIPDAGTQSAGFMHQLHAGGVVSELVEPTAYARARWANQFGTAALQSERPQVQQWAAANKPGAPIDENTAADYVRSTTPPDIAAKYDQRYHTEYQLYHAVQVRDQMADSVAQQWKVTHPNAAGPQADMEMYKAVQQQMLMLGVPEDKLPPFSIRGGNVVPTDVGRVQGMVDSYLKGSADMVYGPAQALEGLGQTVASRFGPQEGAPAQPGFFQQARANTANAAQSWENMLPGSTAAANGSTSAQMMESGARMAPQIAAAIGTGGAVGPGGAGLFGVTGATGKTLATVLQSTQFFAQTAGQSYQGIFDAAKRAGKTDQEASLAAGVGSTIDGVVSAASMKFGALGQMEQRGLRTYLANVIRSAGAQGGVAASQDLVNQFTHYVASDGKEGFDVDRILKAGLAGVVAGAFTMASDPSRVRAAWDTFRNSPPAGAAAAAESMAGKFGDVGMSEPDARKWLNLGDGDLSADEIKKAFRAKVAEAHPDSGGTQEDFAKTMAARAALSRGTNRPRSNPPTAQPKTETPSTDGGANGEATQAGDSINKSQSSEQTPAVSPSTETSSTAKESGSDNNGAPAEANPQPQIPKPKPPGGGAAEAQPPLAATNEPTAVAPTLETPQAKPAEVPQAPTPAAQVSPEPTPPASSKQTHPAELADARAVGQWYAKTFNDTAPESASAIEALASMSGGKYVLAHVPAEKINPSSMMAGDKDPAKVAALNGLTAQERSELPPSILVSSPRGKELMVADGSHRVLSAQATGTKSVLAYVPEHFVGTQGIERAGAESGSDKPQTTAGGVGAQLTPPHAGEVGKEGEAGARGKIETTTEKPAVEQKSEPTKSLPARAEEHTGAKGAGGKQSAIAGAEDVVDEQERLDTYGRALAKESGLPLITARRLAARMHADGTKAMARIEQRDKQVSLKQWVGDQIWDGLQNDKAYTPDEAPHDLLNKMVDEIVGDNDQPAAGEEEEGGKNPRFWGSLSAGVGNVKPTLQGKKLLDEVRRVMKVPTPEQASGTIAGDGRASTDAVREAGGEAAAGGGAGAGSQGPLGEVPPGAAPATATGGATGQRGKGRAAKRAGSLQPAGEQGSERAGGDGGRESEVHPPATGGTGADAGRPTPGQGTTGGQLQQTDADPAHSTPALAGNFSISADVSAKLEAGGAKTKFKNNVLAIETLRRVMADGRQATAAEQEVLALYNGWGQFPQVFNPHAVAEGKWDEERKLIKEMLTGEEWEAARKSTLNAHYSSPLLATTVWKAVDRLGFTGGRVLEPSMGAGIFFGLMPGELREASRLSGIELDPITGNIARLLYPKANVQVKGFQQLVSPPGFFDLAVGNVPFGDYNVHDTHYKQLRTAPIHDYFIIKALDQVRPGGIVALITSTGTLDKQDARWRQMMSDKADLIGAMRLPEGAFSKSAGTEVVTDLLIFQRREQGTTPAGDFVSLKELPDADGGAAIPINAYYADHPQQILGRLDRKSRLYGRGDSHVSRTDDFQERLDAAVASLPAGAFKPVVIERLASKRPTLAAPDSIKDGAYLKQGKKLYRRQGGELVEAKVDPKRAEIIADHMKLRDSLRELIAAELEGKADAEISKKREALGQAYDKFVAKRGPLHKRGNVQAFADDPDSPVVLSLEATYDPKTGLATKADVFSKSTIRGYERPTSAKDAGEALGITLNETGHVDIARVAELLSKSEAVAGDELVKAGLAYRDPAGGWKSAEQYLSGNVKTKLMQARDAAAADAQYKPNVPALEKVQPADVPHDEIDLRLGAGWVPSSDIRDFAQHLMGGIAEHFQIRYLAQNGTWLADYTATGKARHRQSPNDVTVYGTDRAGFMDVLESALNNKTLTITDRDPVDKDKRVVNKEATAAANEKVEKVQQAFRDWVWEGDERRERLHRFYNDTFNNLAPVNFNGSHLTFPGMNPLISLRAHQVNGVWQTVSTGTALYGHEVGTGKTYTMVAAAMELRRLGLSKKPAIGTIKAAFETVVKQARALYPSAKILAVDDFDAKNRKRTISRIATGDWDLVVMTHDQLDMLPMDPEVEAGFIRKELAELEEVKTAVDAEDQQGRRSGRGKSDNRLVKALEKTKARLEARLEEALDSKKDDAITFEQTGIDHLFVDEAHRYKSLPVYTKQDRVKGIPKSRSDRATNMWMRSQWLQQMNNGRGVVFATGTPVTNTMAELYTMQRYLQMRELESRGVAAFDAWASTFGRLVTKMEYTVTGDYAPSTRFAAFTNMPELQQIARQVIDIQRAKDMPGFKRPKRTDEVVKAPMSAEQLAYLGEIKQRAVEAKKKRPGEPGDNMLSISMDARKSALDHRIIDAGAEDYSQSKTNQIVRNVLAILKEHPGTTQMIFSDLGISATDQGFSFYQNLIDKLVAGGVPRGKIINFGDLTDAQKKLSADRLKDGDAWIGIGGSEKLGTGVNAQDHLIALHHADVPWVPAFVEQRDGRGWRQGNKNDAIKIYRYVTEGSFDTFMWQAVDAKTRFINQFMEGRKIGRAISEDDGEELSPAQVMAIASGNPLLLTKIQLDKDVSDLTAAHGRYQREQIKLKDQRAHLAKDIEAEKKKQSMFAADLPLATEHAEDDFSIEIGGKTFDDREQAQDALDQKIEQIPTRSDSDQRVPLGTYRGFPIEGYRVFGGAGVVLVGKHMTYPAEKTIGSIEYRARASSFQSGIDRSRQIQQVYETDLKKLGGQMGQPFAKAAELEAKRKELENVQNRLAAANAPADSSSKPVAAPAEGDEEGEESANLQAEGGEASKPQQPTPLPILLDSKTTHGPAAAGGRSLLRPIEMPELLRLARELMKGGTPLIKKIRGKAAAKFTGKGFGEISIDPRRVKGPHELAAALAHELGHLEDWLPFDPADPATLKRGNIVGSIRKLNRYLGQTNQGVGPNAAIRKELIALSEWWSPYDKPQAKQSYIDYRNGPRELYASALSVLLNAPGEVEARAPLFFKQFLETLDRHPDFSATYLSLQDELAGTPKDLALGRRKDIREAFARGEDIWKARAEERATNRTSIIGIIKQLFFDRAAPALDLQKQAEKKTGSQLADAENAKYALGELNYSDNTNHLMLRKLEEEVVGPVKRAGMNLDHLGEYLQLHRTATERSEMANPQGHTPATAVTMLRDLADELGPVRYATLEAAIVKFHDIIFESVERAGVTGLYAQAKVQELEKNKYNYATFAVLDYLTDHITHAIIQQHGTFKDVANPFVATTMKTMSVNRMNDLTVAQTAVVNMLMHHFADSIEKAPLLRGEGGRPLPPRRPPEGREWLPHYENGVLRHYAVDPYIAKVFQSHDVGMLAAVGRWVSNITYKPFHPLYVTWNVGWAMGLIPSDFQRTYRNNALAGEKVTIRELLRAYKQAGPIALRRVRRMPDATIDAMLKAKAIDVPWMDHEFHNEHDTFARMLDRYGLGNKPQKTGGVVRAAVATVQKTMHAAEALGSFIVSVPKIAGWQILANRNVSPGERAYRVRNQFGHPDRKRKGSATVLTNPVLMYSNILIQFLRADAEAATDPKTRGGFWFRWALTGALPKVLMRLAAAGLLGAGLKAMFDLVPEQDKVKGTVIPFGFTRGPDGHVKVRYALIPTDPFNRIMGGLLWKLTEHKSESMLQRLQQVLDVGYSDAPHISPSMQMAINWSMYLRGQNPYDDFRRRNVISDDDFKAGGWYAFKDMLQWTGNQFGQASVLAHWLVGKNESLGEKETVGEKIVGSIPGVSRFIKTSDRGIREEEEHQHLLEDAEAARFRLGLPDEVRNLVRERYRLELMREQISDDDRRRRAIVNRWYGGAYLKLTKAIKAAEHDGDTAGAKQLRAQLLASAKQFAPEATKEQ